MSQEATSCGLERSALFDVGWQEVTRSEGHELVDVTERAPAHYTGNCWE